MLVTPSPFLVAWKNVLLSSPGWYITVRTYNRRNQMNRVRTAIAATAIAATAVVALPGSAGAAQRYHPKFVNAVHRISPATTVVSNKWLSTFGSDICTDLNSGTTVTEEALSLVQTKQSVFSNRQLGTVMGAAIIYLCPAYKPQMNAFIKTYGS
jgi:hypothetical protein